MASRGGARKGSGRKATREARRTFKLSSCALEFIDSTSAGQGVSKVEVVESALRLLARSQNAHGASDEAEALASRVESEVVRLRPVLPEIDRGDLVLILQSLIRPLGSGRRFILRKACTGLVL